MKITTFIQTITILTLVFLAGCTSQTHERAENARTAKDSRGQNIRLQGPAQRVVALFEPAVDAIYMLQAGERLVGIPQQIYQNEESFNFLSKLDKRIADKSISTPTFGGRSSNVESIIALAPDLVVLYEQDRETAQQLEGLGISVFTVSSGDKEKIFQELMGLGTLLGKKERAEEIVQYVDAETNKMSVPPSSKIKKVYYAWSKGRVFSTSGKGTLIDLSISSAGAENACPLQLEAPNVSAESLYKWNPDIILLWNSQLSDVYNLKELAALPAVKNKQVFVMSPSFYFDPHTVKFMLFAKQLRHWCYPEYTEQEFRTDLHNAFTKLYGKENLI